jgi:hypothetical protein
MLNFTFTRHPKLNLPEEHLAAIEKHLRKRASQLINLSRSKSKDNTKKLSLSDKLDEAKEKVAVQNAERKETQSDKKSENNIEFE